MTDAIDILKAVVAEGLRVSCEPVPPKKATSEQRHLSVWEIRGKTRYIGLEIGHKDRVNLWVTAMYAPKNIPDRVEVSRKVWIGSGWRDTIPDPARKGRDGANSNLKSFEVFNTRPLIRLGIKSVDDARTIMEQLFA